MDAVLSDSSTNGTVPLDRMSLHLIHKLRILHGRTHVGRVAAGGRSSSNEIRSSLLT
ncbi:hypothetical protein SBA3_3140022 [Candidatus Sulfopaludibacter sp. SbA3]|nr:hypothetical protein SBA3_3140022 [Candidatus Sulfopaludibacter sp. SbA3]